jgi:hypothetical protein
MVEQASSFFDAASSARGLDVDCGLLLETHPADLRSSSSPEVASQGSFRSTACPRAMRLGGAGSHVKRLSSFFDAASSARGLDVDRGLLLETRPADLHSSSSPEVASIDDQMLGY